MPAPTEMELKLIERMRPMVDPRVQPHVYSVAVHESGHLAMALAVGCTPCRAEITLSPDQQCAGEVCWRTCTPHVSKIPARNQALISVAGAAAGRHLCGDDSQGAAEISPTDLAGIVSHGFKVNDVLPEALEFVRHHERAIVRIAAALCNRTRLDGRGIFDLLFNDLMLTELRRLNSVARKAL